MLKIYCDICNKELTTEVVGKFVFTEKATALVFVNHKKKDQEGMVQKSYDLCPECVLKIKGVLNI